MFARFTSSRKFHALTRAGVAAAAVAAVAVAGAAPAQAEPINSGVVGAYTDTTCGWYPKDEGPLALWDDKIVRVNLPSVSGVTANQLIWAHVRFVQPDGNGNYPEYRDGWFYTYASPGQLTTTWTSYNTGTAGWTYVEDAPGESGYAAGDTQNPITMAFVRLYWMTGSTQTGIADEVGQNAANPEYPLWCNGGGTIV